MSYGSQEQKPDDSGSDAGPGRSGVVITFYSYKGGTGRTQALANVAFLLASQGFKVCAIDWDLEAPGLHRFFHPFLADQELRVTRGLVDYVWDLSAAALSPPPKDAKPVVPVNLLDYCVAVDWDFANEGCLDLIVAGRQDDAYASRAMSFQWEAFYERLGGGRSLEAARQALVHDYNYVLIDSRTGISDTSGICTIQLPDKLVACYTLNRQSIDGVASVLKTVRSSSSRRIEIYPLEMRVETSEKEKLDGTRRVARPRFQQGTAAMRPSYWEDMEIGYWPFYAFEECLAVFGDDPLARSRSSLIVAMERVAEVVSSQRKVRAPEIDLETRRRVLRAYALGDYEPMSRPGRPEASGSGEDAMPQMTPFWVEVESRFDDWATNYRFAGHGFLAEHRGLLPGSVLYRVLRNRIPPQLGSDRLFMLFVAKSRDWRRTRTLLLVGALLFLAAVAGATVFTWIETRDYLWTYVTALAPVALGVTGFMAVVSATSVRSAKSTRAVSRRPEASSGNRRKPATNSSSAPSTSSSWESEVDE